MKKKCTLLVLLTVMSTLIVTAQSDIYIKGGLNLANVSITDDGGIDDANTLGSFQVGFVGDIQLSKYISLQPGLLVTGKGSKTQSGNAGDANYYRASSNPIYLELPANLVFRVPLEGPNSSFFFGAGPYVAMGFAGKRKAEGSIVGIDFNREDNIEFSDDDPTTSGEEGAGFGILKRWDYGLNGLVGFQGDRAFIAVNYGHGLAKIQSGTTNGDDNNNKHRVLSFVVGFRL